MPCDSQNIPSSGFHGFLCFALGPIGRSSHVCRLSHEHSRVLNAASRDHWHSRHFQRRARPSPSSSTNAGDHEQVTQRLSNRQAFAFLLSPSLRWRNPSCFRSRVACQSLSTAPGLLSYRLSDLLNEHLHARAFLVPICGASGRARACGEGNWTLERVSTPPTDSSNLQFINCTR